MDEEALKHLEADAIKELEDDLEVYCLDSMAARNVDRGAGSLGGAIRGWISGMYRFYHRQKLLLPESPCEPQPVCCWSLGG